MNHNLCVKHLFLDIIFLYIIFLSSCDASDCLTKKLECEKLHQSRKLDKVCGNDNNTYINICHLTMEKCKGVQVDLQHNGRCRFKKPCFRDLKRLQKNKPNDSSFIPTCLEDGRYSPVQCHNQTGYCWCVTSKGRPIFKTSKINEKPKCSKRVKTRRRVSSRTKQHCGQSDLQKFNTNLINWFKKQYKFGKDEVDIEQKVVDKKFDSMDKNKDDLLQRKEYKVLKQIQRLVKPKKCFKSFIKKCDIDQDLMISREEWSLCLSGDIWKASVALSVQLPGFEAKRKEEPEMNDCFSDRQAVLTEQISNDLYVPDCTPDGRYNKIQCYKSTGYCWCVYEDDGKPIPGTSVKDQVPKCDAIPLPVRSMKGCPVEKKTIFLQDLKDYLIKEMNSKNKSANSQWTVMSWSFSELDANNNKYLEKKEWKMFRTQVANVKRLRRCGKRLPKYCDINHDQKISLTEWFNCLETQSSPVTTNIYPSFNLTRKGPNPLASLLKDYD